MKEALVFVCYSALSFDAAKRICRLSPGDAECFLFTLFPVDEGCPDFREIYSMPRMPHRMSEWVKPLAIARWFAKSLERFNQYGFERLRVLVPHPFELPANYFIYSDPRVVGRELLPDGLLNYTTVGFLPTSGKHRARYEVRVLLRKIAARSIKLRYQRLNPGHLTQYEFVDYDRSWTDNRTGFVTSRVQPTQLPAEQEQEQEASSSAPRVLVLDQELAPLVEEKLAQRMRSELVAELGKIGAKHILYKAHPRGRNRESDLRSQGFSVENVTGPELAERIARQRAVTHLIGFYSTPLLTMEDVAARVCILPHPKDSGVKNSHQLEEYVGAFESSGATVRFVARSH